MKKYNPKNNLILNKVPSYVNDADTFNLLYASDVDWQYVYTIKTYSDFNDQVLSEYLNISVKTFREGTSGDVAVFIKTWRSRIWFNEIIRNLVE
jgi:hypothetical protein